MSRATAAKRSVRAEPSHTSQVTATIVTTRSVRRGTLRVLLLSLAQSGKFIPSYRKYGALGLALGTRLGGLPLLFQVRLFYE